MKTVHFIYLGITIAVIMFVANYFLTKQSVNSSMVCSDNIYEAQEKEDVSVCELVKSTMPFGYEMPFYDNRCREQCIRSIAYNKGTPELCELINNMKQIVSTEERINGWQNLNKGGFSIKDQCYKHLAEKLNDVSLCTKSETDYGKEMCSPIVEATLRRQGKLKFVPK